MILLLVLALSLQRLYEKEDPDVLRGNALAAQNDAESALHEYDKAREHLPDSAGLSFNRASALLKLDPGKAPEAASEAAQALQKGDAHLKPQAAYDLALAIEAMGHPDEAMKAYALALGLDPEDRDSKVNLELLLKTQEERKQKQQLGQQQPDKKKQQGKDDQQKQKGEQEQKDQQKEQGQQEEKKEQAEQQQGAKEEKAEKKKEQQQAEEKPVDRSEAERLLDALRAGEKNLQVWRFAKDKRKEARRSEPERDW
jgi:Mg-chelatase subunit ChlI